MSPPVKHELELILKEIRIITDKIKEDDNTTNISGDWKFAAMVLDRSVQKKNFFYISLTILQDVFDILHIFYDDRNRFSAACCPSCYSHIKQNGKNKIYQNLSRTILQGCERKFISENTVQSFSLAISNKFNNIVWKFYVQFYHENPSDNNSYCLVFCWL